MPLNWQLLCGFMIGLTGCATFPSTRPPEPPPVPGREARKALQAYPATDALPAAIREVWIESIGSQFEASRATESLQAELNRNAPGRKQMGHAMTELVNAAWNGGDRPESMEDGVDPAMLVRLHDPALVLRLIAPALAEGGDLENALIAGDPELPRLFENPGDSDADPGFGLYVDVIDEEGLESPVAHALITRMFYVRPVRTMDLMLERYADDIPDLLPLFGVQQGVRLRLMRQRLDETTAREALEWMTRVLAPLQGHEQWWVRYYARRLLELQVKRVSAE